MNLDLPPGIDSDWSNSYSEKLFRFPFSPRISIGEDAGLAFTSAPTSLLLLATPWVLWLGGRLSYYVTSSGFLWQWEVDSGAGSTTNLLTNLSHHRRMPSWDNACARLTHRAFHQSCVAAISGATRLNFISFFIIKSVIRTKSVWPAELDSSRRTGTFPEIRTPQSLDSGIRKFDDTRRYKKKMTTQQINAK